ncbi:3',5'-cyclic-nucleotide phosphodiesterase [Microbotryomycetes sp. JL201]|nr:3',5'-cyclic-nucleotide phosphodiesterase [Microbotryomycetes sp. JL201]
MFTNPFAPNGPPVLPTTVLHPVAPNSTFPVSQSLRRTSLVRATTPSSSTGDLTVLTGAGSARPGSPASSPTSGSGGGSTAHGPGPLQAPFAKRPASPQSATHHTRSPTSSPVSGRRPSGHTFTESAGAHSPRAAARPRSMSSDRISDHSRRGSLQANQTGTSSPLRSPAASTALAPPFFSSLINPAAASSSSSLLNAHVPDFPRRRSVDVGVLGMSNHRLNGINPLSKRVKEAIGPDAGDKETGVVGAKGAKDRLLGRHLASLLAHSLSLCATDESQPEQVAHEPLAAIPGSPVSSAVPSRNTSLSTESAAFSLSGSLASQSPPDVEAAPPLPSTRLPTAAPAFPILSEAKRSKMIGILQSWSFNAMAFSSDDLLSAVGIIFEGVRNMDGVDFDLAQFKGLLLSLRSAYHARNGYHNFAHAADVTQACYSFLVRMGLAPPLYLLCEDDYDPNMGEGRRKWRRNRAVDQGGMGELLRPMDVFALMVAAIGHDVGHPGLSNAYLVNAKAPVAQVYNDRSVLENFHTVTLIHMLRKHRFDHLLGGDFGHLGDQATSFRKILEASILATDMSQHFAFVTDLTELGRRMMERRGPANPESLEADRLLLCSGLMKCADISNPTRPHRISRAWSTALLQEWTMQASIEAHFNLPISVMSIDPSDTKAQAKSQIGFIDLFAKPLFAAMATVVDEMADFVDKLRDGRIAWEAISLQTDEAFSQPIPTTWKLSPAPSGRVPLADQSTSEPEEGTPRPDAYDDPAQPFGADRQAPSLPRQRTLPRPVTMSSRPSHRRHGRTNSGGSSSSINASPLSPAFSASASSVTTGATSSFSAMQLSYGADVLPGVSPRSGSTYESLLPMALQKSSCGGLCQTATAMCSVCAKREYSRRGSLGRALTGIQSQEEEDSYDDEAELEEEDPNVWPPFPFISGFGGFGQQQQQQPQQQQPSTGLFGQTSTGFGSGAFGQTSSTPAFGQQAQQPTQTTGFGGFGQTQQNATPAFGAASSTPAFGQPAASGGGGLFGASNTASNTGTSGFSFGGSSNTGTSLFSQSNNAAGNTAAGGIFGAKPATTFGGFGSTTTQQQPATGGGLFGASNNTISSFGAQPQQGQGTGTAIAPYQISTILEPPKEEGKPDPPNQTPHAFQSITCMPQYAAYSFEELRWQDYQANRKAPTAPPAFGGFGASSAFGGATTTPSTGLFGSTAPTFGASATSSAPAFGAPQQQSTGLFGSTNTSSPFGQPAQQQQTGGLFGSATSQPAATGGLFGSAPKPATSTFGGFGQTQTSTAPSTGFSFGAPAASTAPASGGLFGSASSAPATGGLFGQSAQSQPTATGGLFGQTATSQPASTPSFSFGATSTAPKPLFGAAPTSTPAFGATAAATAPKPTFSFGSTPSSGTSLFGQPAQSAQPAQSQPAPTFGQQPAAGTSLFGNTGSTFGQQPTTSTAPSFGGGLFGAKPAAPATSGLFGSTSTTAPSLFGSQPAQQQPQAQQQPASLFGSTVGTFGSGMSTASQPQQPTAYATADDANAYGSNPLFQSTKPAVARATDEKKKPPIFSSFRSTPVSKSATKITRLRGFGSPASFNGSASPAPLSSSISSKATASPGRTTPLKLVAGVGDDAALSPNAFVNRSSVKKLVIDRKGISQSPFSKSRAGSAAPSNGDGTDGRLKVTFDPEAESGLRGSPFASSTNVHALGEEGDSSILSAGTPVKRNNDAGLDHGKLTDSATKETPDRRESARGGKHGTYYSIPSIEALRKMPANALRSVKDLVVGRVGYGQVAFLQPVDLTTLHSVEDLLGGIVVFEDRNCTVYPDEMESKPRPGQGLNVPATITLERCWPLDKSSRKPIKEGPKLDKHIKRLQTLENTHWVDFDVETGEWYEGRRTWASLTSTCRSMLRVLAFALPPPTAAPSRQSQAMHELCQLIVAFCWATMYRLRDEPGVDHAELKELVPAALLSAFAHVPELDDGKVRHSSAPESARAVAALNTTTVPSVTRHYHLARIHAGASNLPLSLTRAIHAYLNEFYTTPLSSEGSPRKDTPALDAPTWSACMNHLNQMTDHLSTLERIRDTPIPLILSIQLQALLYIYVAAVPLQLVRTLHIWSIPATAIACAVFFGVDRAAEELSDPFGTEPNDLPIAKFCEQIHAEYREMVNGSEWVPAPLEK